MRIDSWCSRLLAVLVVWLPATAFGGDLKQADWAMIAPIALDEASLRPVAQCELTPELMDYSQPDFRDLRLIAGTKEVGFVMRINRESTRSVPLPVTLYNRTFVPDRESAVTVDFGAKILKNRVLITTPGSNFRRGVRSEGSDDGKTWKIVREREWLFRFQRSDGTSPAFESNVVSFPDNDFRYLRITVFNGQDDKGSLEIGDVKAFRYVVTPAETVAVPVTCKKNELKKNDTYLTMDLGSRHLPLHEMKLDFSDQNFFRRVRFWGRNQETRVEKREVENSPGQEKTVDEPWISIGSGTIYRFSSDSAADESVTLRLNGAYYRYLLICIEHKDDPPLNFTRATASRFIPRIEFCPSRGSQYSLITGNPNAQAPTYDVGHYIAKLRGQGVTTAHLGKVEPNPAHKVQEQILPWSERHKEMLWIVLLAMACVLGLLVYRMALSAKGQSEQSGTDKR